MTVGRIHLYSDRLPPDDYPSTGVNVTSSIQSTIDESLSRHSDSAVAVIPEGPYVVPIHLARIAST